MQKSIIILRYSVTIVLPVNINFLSSKHKAAYLHESPLDLAVSWSTLRKPTTTNSINLIHEDDTGLMISGITKHLPDQTSTLTNVLVYYCTGHHLEIGINRDITSKKRKVHKNNNIIVFIIHCLIMQMNYTDIIICITLHVKLCSVHKMPGFNITLFCLCVCVCVYEPLSFSVPV